jgi:two-component system sensor histidine kinase AgrC
MQLSMYEWVFIITSVFGAYTVYKFMTVFFETKNSHRKVELLSYIGYFLVISVIYLVVNIPIVLLIANLLALIGLTYNYQSAFKKRVLVVVFIYLIFMSVEMTVALITGYINFPLFSENNYSSIFGLIFFRILSYVVVLVFNNFTNIKRGEIVPNSYWLSLVLIPATSLYVILLLFQAEGLSAVQVILSVILLLFVNFATFYLYDAITAALSERMERRLIIEQNKYYDRQLELMRASLETTRAIRHDLKNHMYSISALVKSNDREQILHYLADIMEDFGAEKHYASSGNIIIDSIINFKFQDAERRNITTTLDLNIPENLEIPSIDMTIILGNLLDNAIEAASEVKESPYIDVKIKYDKGRLFLQVKNPYVGEVIEKDGRFITTKNDRENHGIGLDSVAKVVLKYDGTMSVDYSDNIFSVAVLMYVD